MKLNHVLTGIALPFVFALPGVHAADSMALQERHEIQRECERLVIKFLHLFEGEHGKTADLFTEDGQAFDNVGREKIREAFSKIDARDVEVNVLISTNLIIDVTDENHATGAGYVTHYQYAHADSKREGQPALRTPNTITKWSWEFRQADGKWRISKLKTPESILIREDLFKYIQPKS